MNKSVVWGHAKKRGAGEIRLKVEKSSKNAQIKVFFRQESHFSQNFFKNSANEQKLFYF